MAKKKVEPAENQLSLIGDLLPKQEFTEEQKTFIEYDGKKSIRLAATAGAGKTHSCVERLKTLLDRGIDPKKIIFFSFTKAAADELTKRINRTDVEIKTIHAFCQKLLVRMGKYKDIISIYDFIKWFSKKYSPGYKAAIEDRAEYEEIISKLWEDAELFSSSFSAFKLQTADGEKCKMPDLFLEYASYLKEERCRDFADMLIDVRNFLKDNKWLKMFKDQYDYIFVDEYQDTSAIQMEILLCLNAKYYALIGDVNQCIYGYSGANCTKIENMLSKRRDVENMTLSTNFRSDKSIISNSNKYSSLQAVANSKEEGYVNKKILFRLENLVDLMNEKKELVVLVRTNAVIKQLEFELMKKQVPMRYFNWITETELKEAKKGELRPITKQKLDWVSRETQMSHAQILSFIEQNSESKRFVTSIHKSKGREFEACVVVNSIAPDVLEENGVIDKLNEKQLERLSFKMDSIDLEPKNIHYVAVSRSKHELYFMIYDI